MAISKAQLRNLKISGYIGTFDYVNGFPGKSWNNLENRADGPISPIRGE